MARRAAPPTDVCPYCGQGTSLQISVTARHGRSALLRSMWCANCRGPYLALRRLLPDVLVVDKSRSRPPARFDAEKLRRSISEPVRKPTSDGFRDPNTQSLIPPSLQALAAEYVFDFVVEQMARVAPEPNGEVTTDQIAEIVLVALHRTHVLAFLRSAVHHRLMRLAGEAAEMEELADIADQLVKEAQTHNERQELSLPALREPPAPVLCPRCGTQRVARRSRSSTIRGLEQQPASCSNCGQRYTWEWGSQMPLLVTTGEQEALFDLPRFRGGIRSAVRKLPGPAAIWSDEKLIASAANTASISATPFMRSPTPEHPVPSIDAADLWLAAASALRSIHPLAFVRYALHSKAIDGLDWENPENTRRLKRMETIVQNIGRRYFGSNRFPHATSQAADDM